MTREEKIQNYVLKTLLKNKPVFYSELDAANISITWDGYRLQIIPKSAICFALDKCKKRYDLTEALVKNSNDVELTTTNELIVKGKNTAQKLKAPNFSAWVNSKYIKDCCDDKDLRKNNISRLKFYGCHSKGRILVEDAGIIIGCILPLNKEGE